MIAKSLLSIVLVAAAASPSADTRPPPGSHGFNWLDPDSQCRVLAEADLARITSCQAQDNAFGLELPAQACKVDDDTEWMVYATAAQCEQAWETMQANGP